MSIQVTIQIKSQESFNKFLVYYYKLVRRRRLTSICQRCTSTVATATSYSCCCCCCWRRRWWWWRRVVETIKAASSSHRLSDHSVHVLSLVWCCGTRQWRWQLTSDNNNMQLLQQQLLILLLLSFSFVQLDYRTDVTAGSANEPRYSLPITRIYILCSVIFQCSHAVGWPTRKKMRPVKVCRNNYLKLTFGA